MHAPHGASSLRPRTVLQVARGLEGDVDRDGRVQHRRRLPVPALPRHVVWQLRMPGQAHSRHGQKNLIYGRTNSSAEQMSRLLPLLTVGSPGPLAHVYRRMHACRAGGPTAAGVSHRTRLLLPLKQSAWQQCAPTVASTGEHASQPVHYARLVREQQQGRARTWRKQLVTERRSMRPSPSQARRATAPSGPRTPPPHVPSASACVCVSAQSEASSRTHTPAAERHTPTKST